MREQFKLGETYSNRIGGSVRIICVDSEMRYSGVTRCPIVGEVTPKGFSYPNSLLYYDSEGRYCGLTSKECEKHHLISNEPTEEELALIAQIGDYCERRDDNREQSLLKIIRQLRKK